MAIIKIYTDGGKLVSTMVSDDNWTANIRGRKITGHMNGMYGWMERALQDARLIQRGIDPERPSEKAMRMIAERKNSDDAA